MTLKKLFVAAGLLAAGAIMSYAGEADDDENYAIVFIKDVVPYISTKFDDRAEFDIIRAGAVCIGSGQSYYFPHIDCCEGLTIRKGYVEYFPATNDYRESQYIPLGRFWQSVMKVKLRDPALCLEEGMIYRFHSQKSPDECLYIRPIRVKDPDAVVYGDETLYGKMVYEIEDEYGKSYMYDGSEIEEDQWERVCSLFIDDTGHCFSIDVAGKIRPTSKLGCVRGYPSHEYFGCISPEEIIVDDALYVLDSFKQVH